jgi:hypothetical protein
VVGGLVGLAVSPAVWLAAGMAAGAGAFILLMQPRAARQLGGLLDRAFRLDDLVVTALEVDRRGPASDVEARLLDDAAAALARIEAEPSLLGDAIAREAETLAATAMILAGLWLVSGAIGASPEPARLAAVGPGGEGDAGSQTWTDPAPASPAEAPIAATALVRTAPPEAASAAATPAPTSTRPAASGSAVPLAAPAGSRPGARGSGEAVGDAGTGAARPGRGGADLGPEPPDSPWDQRETVRRYFETP